MTRLVGSFLFVSLMTVGLLGALAFAQARQALQEAVLQSLEVSADLEEQTLSIWVEEETEIFELLTEMPGVSDRLEHLLHSAAAGDDRTAARTAVAESLSVTVEMRSAWQEILLLSSRAEILYSTEEEHWGKYRVLDRYFKSGSTGSFLQKVYPSPMTFVPTMTLSKPVVGKASGHTQGSNLGVIALHLNLERMDEIVLDQRSNSEGSESYLVDLFNVFISSKRFGTEEFPRGVRSFGIDNALQGHDGWGLYENYRGTPVIGVYRWIEELDVALLTEMPQAEAFAPARRLALTIGLLGLSLAAVLCVGIFLLARQIARPILEVSKTALEVAEGNLGARAPVLTDDEIGVLAQTFNDMTGRLSVLYENLQAEIGERRRIESERGDLIAELEGRNAELERFTYTVSHDLKSPLVTIRGFLGLLQRDAEQGNKKRMDDDIRRIHNASETMMRLLDELLELSRVGRLVNPPEAVPLSELASEVSELLAGAIAARGATVEVRPDLPEVYGDRMRLLEVLQNLVENAIKFMGEQPQPHIVIDAELTGDDVLCRVQDNGIGIDPRYHEKIFGLFDRLDVSSEGTGIGLALVQRIIQVHNGRIWVESEGVGNGATFLFTLPRADLQTGTSAPGAEPDAAAAQDGEEPDAEEEEP